MSVERARRASDIYQARRSNDAMLAGEMELESHMHGERTKG
jgi:phosphotransacetylase